MKSKSFFWYDLETTGTDTALDRAVQFAGVRTDENLEEIEEGYELVCRPPLERLPHPEAVAITRFDYNEFLRKGLIENEFCRRISDEFERNETCVAGFNSIRFDDELIRQLFYRNFRDPYAREWKNGNSRWDLIDPLRAAYALRPEGINWPRKKDGSVSFRLEDLASANAVVHENAHDALSDVRATIGLARILKKAQPKLFDFSLSLRSKINVQRILNPAGKNCAVYVSPKIGSENSNLGIVFPVCSHPINKNSIICFDLKFDPSCLEELSSDALEKGLDGSEFPEEANETHLFEINTGRLPFVAPLNVLNEETLSRLNIDLDLAKERSEFLASSIVLGKKIKTSYSNRTFELDPDPELQLYGGFFTDGDRELMKETVRSEPDLLSGFSEKFQDPRLAEILFRYRCRNFPETLSSWEVDRWKGFLDHRLEKGKIIEKYISETQRLISSSGGDNIYALNRLLEYYEYVAQQIQR
ncbi:MAG: exodeoxyribonuclease I [Gammaproteobacteria bacterium]|nr:exodeoxyribonuclease I [Gammaproteobacteria bacterium]|tara:strand:+ start:661 stop:2079 length:1419 start_codon:yes stop_codon:yes gene_type:complete